jgi:hypothetical protein
LHQSTGTGFCDDGGYYHYWHWHWHCLENILVVQFRLTFYEEVVVLSTTANFLIQKTNAKQDYSIYLCRRKEQQGIQGNGYFLHHNY